MGDIDIEVSIRKGAVTKCTFLHFRAAPFGLFI